jgi:alpha-tubulin suppressor-like RCC1 family protein
VWEGTHVTAQDRTAPRKLGILLLALALAGLALASSANAAPNTGVSWGSDGFGLLGNGPATTDSAVPTPMSNLSGATQLSSGTGDHALALMADGTVKAWGANGRGQMGTGANTGPDDCGGGTPCGMTPTTVPGVTNAIAVAAGGAHSMALLANGQVMTWGSNRLGQLGNGGDSGPDDCGGGGPCQLDAAVVPGLSDVVAIAAGGQHSLALRSNGLVMAWGGNQNGQLGQDTSGPADCGEGKCATAPLLVPTFTNAVDIAAGDGHSLAVLSDGTARGWGSNGYGETGLGSPTLSGCFCQSTPVTVTGVSGAVEVAAGYGHSLALLANGTVRGWGDNENGEVGNGTISASGCACIASPTEVVGLSGVAEIATGSYTSLALTSAGAVKAWGSNGQGRLGNNDPGTDSGFAVDVFGLTNATALGASYSHSMALVGDRQLLSVTLEGLGAGKVVAPGVFCSPVCSRNYPEGAKVRLLAIADPSTFFAGYSGACTGPGACTVTMDQARAVTARFGDLPDPTPPAPDPGVAAATGQRSAALEKCLNKKTKKARRKCARKAKRLPL